MAFLLNKNISKENKLITDIYNELFFNNDNNIFWVWRNINKALVLISFFVIPLIIPILLLAFDGIDNFINIGHYNTVISLFSSFTVIGFLITVFLFFMPNFFPFKKNIVKKIRLNERNINIHIGTAISPLNDIYFICYIFNSLLLILWSSCSFIIWKKVSLYFDLDALISDFLNYIFIGLTIFEVVSILKKEIPKYIKFKHYIKKYLYYNNIYDENLFNGMKIIEGRYAYNELLEIKTKKYFFHHPNKKTDLNLIGNDEQINDFILNFYKHLWHEFMIFKNNSEISQYKKNKISFYYLYIKFQSYS